MINNNLKFMQAELLAVCPMPAYTIKHASVVIYVDGNKTKHISITPEQFSAIEKVLYGVPNITLGK